MTGRLEPDERRELLRLARASIRQAIEGERSAERVLAGVRPTAAMQVRRGVFVTLHAIGPGGRSKLRGCIGSIAADAPLHEAVVRVAPRAARDDPRFPPLGPDELDRIAIEISALSPFRPLSSPAEIVVGRHGVSLAAAGSSALFLPRVASDMGWDAERLLAELARKAGLPPAGWRGAEISLFEAETFAEPPPGA